MIDKHEGQGGSYVIDEHGARTLIDRTREPGDEPAAGTEHHEPADAGFFTPVAPADQPTTTE